MRFRGGESSHASALSWPDLGTEAISGGGVALLKSSHLADEAVVDGREAVLLLLELVGPCLCRYAELALARQLLLNFFNLFSRERSAGAQDWSGQVRIHSFRNQGWVIRRSMLT